ncbi:MAG: ATP-binding protein [Chitinophagaceae bacterium]|nr:ATP-binding protein [Chitinophagaceae bacterium]
MLFQPYVENAIRHGIRHLENKKGKVEIRLLQRNGMLECRIDDNGIGREKAQQIQKNTHIEYQSKGMQLSRRRAALYGIDCEILDKKNEEGKPEGTTVILKIPLNEIQF